MKSFSGLLISESVSRSLSIWYQNCNVHLPRGHNGNCLAKLVILSREHPKRFELTVLRKRTHEFDGHPYLNDSDAQAMAYIPSFLEDRSILVKERINRLSGPAAFLIANFIIGIPFLCTFSEALYSSSSHHRARILIASVQTHWSPRRVPPVYKLSGPYIFRSYGRGVSCRLDLEHFSNFRGSVSAHSLHECSMDGFRWLPGFPRSSQHLLAILVLSVWLSAIYVRGTRPQSNGG